MKCQLCGKEVEGKLSGVYIMGKDFKCCSECEKAYVKTLSSMGGRKSQGEEYFRNICENRESDTDIEVILRSLSGQQVSKQEAEAAVDNIKFHTGNDSVKTVAESSASGGGTGLVVAGLIFLLAAVILYFVSVNNDYGVANIQATTFAAANLVCAVVCFSARSVIKAIGSR